MFNDQALWLIAQTKQQELLQEAQHHRLAVHRPPQPLAERALFWQGYRAALPLLIGVAPFGVVFGALAISVGMTPLAAVGMSLFVLAGSSQFIATELIGDGASVFIIILTTFLLNIRHALYSITLAPLLRSLTKGWRWLLAFVLVDEAYATVMGYHQQRNFSPGGLAWFFLGVSTNLVTVWLLTTALGATLGNILPEHLTETLGFSLPLIFITLIIPLLVTRSTMLAALSAGLVGIIFAPMPHQLGLLMAAGVGVSIGVMTEPKHPIQQEQ